MANSIEKVNDMGIESIAKQSTHALAPLAPSAASIHQQPFISALLFLKDLLKKIVGETDTYSSSSTALETHTHTTELSDTFHFGMSRDQLEQLKEQGLLLPTIQERRLELCEQKEHWRFFVDKMKHGNDREFYARVETILEEGNLIPNPSGAGSAYFVIDAQGLPQFVIKPVDGDIFCLNNPKELGSVYNDSNHRVRDAIPLYRSAQTDAFCWELASIAQLQKTTPKAVIGILKDSRFYDFTGWLDEGIKDRVIQETGLPDKEKLCSIQEFIPDSQDLEELLHEFYAQKLSDEDIASSFDQTEFEQVCMLLWLSYDNDAHGGNFRTYVKRVDERGKKIYGIKKIDNGLSFPVRNMQYVNILAWLPNALSVASVELKEKIANLPVEQILKRMDDYELSICKEAFKERVEILKILAQREGITVGEIDLRLHFLSREGGKEIALNSMTTQQILDLLIGQSTSTATCMLTSQGAPIAAA